MNLDNPVIAIIGSGAVGGYYGARLAQHGFDVHFLLRSDFDAVRSRGWTIKSRDGDLVLQPHEIHVYDDVQKMPKADLILVTLKATANDQYEPLIRPLLKEQTAILTLQNGLGNEDHLAELFGAQRILGGLAFVCINRISPGVIHHLDHGMIRLGEFGGGAGPRASRIAEMFNMSRVRCQVLDNLLYGRWEKLIWNIPFNGLGALLDLATDRLIDTEEGVMLIRALMKEVIAAARGNGVELPDGLIEKKIRETQSMGAYRTSMQIDRQIGRPLEIEAILGRPLRVAQAAGISTPRLEMLHAMMRLSFPLGQAHA